MSVLAGHRVVPLAAPKDADEASAIGDGLVAGGMPILEVALRTPYAPIALALLAARSDLIVGAGTVLDREQAGRALDAGAEFLVSPGLLPEVIEVGLEAGVPVLPGVATASEVMQARALGLRQVKLFPAGLAGGPKILAAFESVFTEMQFMPSGGVNLANMADYLDLRNVFAISGSWIAAGAGGPSGQESVSAAASQALEAATR